jgi:phosphoesterase RecJ-like protein
MKNDFNENLSILNKTIEKNRTFVILSHTKPDGDAVGSELALCKHLKGRKKKVECFSDDIPKIYSFLDGIRKIKPLDNLPGECDICIILDSSNLERCAVEKLPNYNILVNIDHHRDNTYFGDINIIDPSAASTANILFRFFKHIKTDLNKSIAESLYAAIITDTGRFSYANTDLETFLIVADLVKHGASPQKITDKIYKNYSLRNAFIYSKVLSSLRSYNEGELLTIELPFEVIKREGIQSHETEGFMDYIQGIEGHEIALFFKEFEKDVVRISLRSKGRIDVQEIASQHNGGGHKFAAGCTINNDFEQAKKIIINESLKKIRKSQDFS